MKYLIFLLTLAQLTLSQTLVFQTTDTMCGQVVYLEASRLSFLKNRVVKSYSYKGELINTFTLDASCGANWSCWISSKMFDGDAGFEYVYNTYDPLSCEVTHKVVNNGVVTMTGKGSACIGFDRSDFYIMVFSPQGLKIYFIRKIQNIKTKELIKKFVIKNSEIAVYNLLGRKMSGELFPSGIYAQQHKFFSNLK